MEDVTRVQMTTQGTLIVLAQMGPCWQALVLVIPLNIFTELLSFRNQGNKPEVGLRTEFLTMK